MIDYQEKPGDAFNKKDPVKIKSNGQTIFTTVFKQDHQWLFTAAGTFNLAHQDVKAYRGIERYEDQGHC